MEYLVEYARVFYKESWWQMEANSKVTFPKIPPITAFRRVVSEANDES